MMHERAGGGLEHMVGLAEGKAIALLYGFHALRFPTAIAHHQVVQNITGFESLNAPEEFMTYGNVPTRGKVLYLRNQFLGMSAALRQIGVIDAGTYAATLEWCDRALEDTPTGSDLVDDSGRLLAACTILPPAHIISAMKRDFLDPPARYRRYRCVELETFIDQTFLRQAS